MKSILIDALKTSYKMHVFWYIGVLYATTLIAPPLAELTAALIPISWAGELFLQWQPSFPRWLTSMDIMKELNF